MKRGIVLTILGIVGVVQYVFIQSFTTLAYNVRYDQDTGYYFTTRDWTAGMGMMLIGIILLVIGISFIRNYKRMKARES